MQGGQVRLVAVKVFLPLVLVLEGKPDFGFCEFLDEAREVQFPEGVEGRAELGDAETFPHPVKELFALFLLVGSGLLGSKHLVHEDAPFVICRLHMTLDKLFLLWWKT